MDNQHACHGMGHAILIARLMKRRVGLESNSSRVTFRIDGFILGMSLSSSGILLHHVYAFEFCGGTRSDDSPSMRRAYLRNSFQCRITVFRLRRQDLASIHREFQRPVQSRGDHLSDLIFLGFDAGNAGDHSTQRFPPARIASGSRTHVLKNKWLSAIT